MLKTGRSGSWELNPSSHSHGPRSLTGAGLGRKEAWLNNELQEAAAAAANQGPDSANIDRRQSSHSQGSSLGSPSWQCPGLSWG